MYKFTRDKRNCNENCQRILSRFWDLYDRDPTLRVVVANDEEDLELLYEIFCIKKELDILDISPIEKWNWLHQCNLSPDDPAPLSVVEFYIQHNVPVNAQDMYKMTPLHYALRSKNVDGAMALLKAGADPNIPDEDNAIALAYINGMPKELELLALMLEKGGDVHFHNGDDEVLDGIKKYKSHDPDFLPVIELMEKYA